MAEHYLGNPLLKKANTIVEFTEDQVLEFARCQNDPLYFAKNYIQIVTLDHGLQPFRPYPFQENMIERFHNYRFNVCKLPRQSGKSTIVVSYLLFYAIKLLLLLHQHPQFVVDHITLSSSTNLLLFPIILLISFSVQFILLFLLVRILK